MLTGIGGDRRSSKGKRRDENAKVCIVQSIRGGGGAGRRLMDKCLSASVKSFAPVLSVWERLVFSNWSSTTTLL